MTERRRKAIIKRRLTIILLLAVLAAAVLLAGFLISKAVRKDAGDSKTDGSDISPTSSQESEKSENNTASAPRDESLPDTVTIGEFTLDANYSNLFLVNGENPLPEDYDYEGNLLTMDEKYINGSLRQIDKDIWPYMRAMIETAWKDGVKLYMWSPYRSYDTQNMLYQNQVKRCMDKGLDRAAAEAEAATVVARPGTSEHHTGLACDFNMASDEFENTEMYRWMTENAEKFGFIMRYSKEKQPITGVIHESWHWRFVGINVAKEINSLDMCLEEYLEYKNSGK